jgi:hypothetical protein
MRKSFAGWLVGLGGLLIVQSATPSQALEMDYFYDRPAAPHLQEIYNQLSSRNTLAQIHEYLAPLHLPAKLVLRISECGSDSITRDYAPNSDLVVCYEYLQRAWELSRSAKDPDPTATRDIRAVIVDGSLAHATLQLVSRSIFDQFKTPIWGNRTDAADRLASYIMVALSPEKSRQWFLGAGYYFALSGGDSTADFTSLNTPDSQRFYDHFCFAQAASPAEFAKLVGIVAQKIFGGEDAEKLKRVFDARAMQDQESKMKAVEGLDPNDKVFRTRFYRRMRLCPLEYTESKSTFDREFRTELTRAEPRK